MGLLAWVKKNDVPACRVEVTSHGITVSGARDDLLLDLLLREGFDAPFGCRAGSCGECKCRLLEGKVKERIDTAYVLGAEELRDGYVLACQSELRSDVRVAYEAPAAGAGPDFKPPRPRL